MSNKANDKALVDKVNKCFSIGFDYANAHLRHRLRFGYTLDLQYLPDKRFFAGLRLMLSDTQNLYVIVNTAKVSRETPDDTLRAIAVHEFAHWVLYYHNDKYGLGLMWAYDESVANGFVVACGLMPRFENGYWFSRARPRYYDCLDVLLRPECRQRFQCLMKEISQNENAY